MACRRFEPSFFRHPPFMAIPLPLYIFFKAPTFGNTFFDNIDIKLFFYVSKTIEPRCVLSLWATLLYTTPCGDLIQMKDFPRKQHYYYKIYTSLTKSAFAPCSIDNLPIFKRKWSRQKNATIISLEWKIILPKGNNYVEWKYDAESWFLPNSTKDFVYNQLFQKPDPCYKAFSKEIFSEQRIKPLVPEFYWKVTHT